MLIPIKSGYRSFTAATLLFGCLALVTNKSHAEEVKLSDLNLTHVEQGWGVPGKNRSVSGNALSIGGKAFSHGIGTHSKSICKINLNRSATRFQAIVGIDSESGNSGSVEFQIELDGKTVWESGVIKGGEQARKVDVKLKGAKTMKLIVTDGGDGTTSDHANWAEATITYVGKAPAIVSNAYPYPAPKEAPGGPTNVASILKVGGDKKSLTLNYNHRTLLRGTFSDEVDATAEVSGETALEQRIKLKFAQAAEFKAVVHASSEALAAETRGSAQKKFAVVRTSHGLSNNLRNNAIYDRNLDWMLEAPEGSVIKSFRNADGTTRFELTFTAKEAELVFRPRYYQKHKNIPYFQPWTYKIRKDSISGWCSWWAYMRNCRQEHVDAVMEVWNEKNLGDFGYHFIQLDDVFQGGKDAGRKLPPEMRNKNYIGGRPETWLEWQPGGYPKGMKGYVKSVEKSGFKPALWMGCFFTDKEIADQHPEWFVQGKDGKPFVGNWVTYVVDSTNPEAADKLIRPTFRGLKKAGFKYIKIDQLRHMIYDNLNHNHDYMIESGKRPDDIFRAYMRIAREELGNDCFILSCWGVLPESVGLADACRIGGDGYGPVTMQQYNSWNGIVWRNDPDHCDVSPRKAAQDVGNVLKRTSIQAADNDTIIRPALASIAGCLLMLSDKPDIYKDDRNLVGAKRSAPVLFSVPGQLYDFDPQKTDLVKSIDRASMKGSSGSNLIDGDQFGYVCPFWLNEFNKPYENWNVLHRLNWTGGAHGANDAKAESATAVTVSFANLGLDASKEYLVYEFWSDKFLGVLKDEIKLGELEPMGLQSIAIREKLNRPQLVSTSRHLSQGAAEIKQMSWEDNTLAGRSQLIVDDRYILTLHVPAGYKCTTATFNGRQAAVEQSENLLKVSCLPKETSSVGWEVRFTK